MMAIGLAAAWLTPVYGPLAPDFSAQFDGADSGIVSIVPSPLIASATVRALTATLMMAAAMGLMSAINRWFNLTRSTSPAYLGFTALLLGALPGLLLTGTGGFALALIVIFGILVMFTVYDRPRNTRRVFLLFFLLGCGACVQSAYLIYAAVFVPACGQMRCFTLRSLMAALLGIFTPLWLLCGSGLVSPEALKMPVFEPISVEALKAYPVDVVIFTASIVTLSFVTMVINVLKVYGFNAKTRAVTGVMAVMTLTTEVMCFVDWGQLHAMLPLLYCLTALQCALTVHFYSSRRGYLLALTVMALCGAIYFHSLCDLIL